jgi:glycosyltransferase involved in cell wall biosynthesis
MSVFRLERCLSASPEEKRCEMSASAAPRILHVVSSLDRGGIEMWLLHLLRHVDRQRYPMDVLVLNARRGPLESDLRALGCRAFYCAGHRKPWILQRFVSDLLRRHGPYDIVHSHVHRFGGVIMRIAAGQGVPIRIVHSRNDMRPVEGRAGRLRRIYTRTMQRWINAYATSLIAISADAAEDLFGSGWRRDDRCSIIYSGRDLSAFARQGDRAAIRQPLRLPADALVIGHVGRFHERKNHGLIIEVAAEVFRREPSARLLLVGDGDGEAKVRAHVAALGIEDCVVFAGASMQVPQLLRHAMDVFLFPSHHEGLGVAVVEAQAAGLPCVVADHLPDEIDVVPELVHRVPLFAGPAAWASAVLSAANDRRIEVTEALAAVLATDFNIERSVGKIAQIYDQERNRLSRG